MMQVSVVYVQAGSIDSEKGPTTFHSLAHTMTDSKLLLLLDIHDGMRRSPDRESQFTETEALRLCRSQAREGSGILIFRGSGNG